VMSRNGKNNDNGDFDWRDALIDSAIVGAFGFVTTLGAIGATGITSDLQHALIAASIVGATQFLGWLMLKRGLRPVPKEAKE